MVGADHLIGGVDGGNRRGTLVEHEAAIGDGALMVGEDGIGPPLLLSWGTKDHLLHRIRGGETRVSASRSSGLVLARGLGDGTRCSKALRSRERGARF